MGFEETRGELIAERHHTGRAPRVDEVESKGSVFAK